MGESGGKQVLICEKRMKTGKSKRKWARGLGGGIRRFESTILRETDRQKKTFKKFSCNITTYMSWTLQPIDRIV